ncbi:hypothetical protein ABB37_08309 [Leptomonas pyrrhocoris]|uniref:DUF866 domain-containing protein n=1 Tax=Leptomonas pyrrhocoris TaxID=157538 RepID=A0A0N0DSL5_LEPPY|nr:hypothetical protein ABB37_08309 [Leptomonas pyrrhocoris]XP_015654220.1 hypothetical protein ABB37_08309 [Leptomonas pyrrhocoris]KPA75780.1 hypothetical protein ABB37_08309 [Leptomonas pyrrhocoris]KPA75781.1 hypothetical protein ABB37_08309 [Leptomonas pyrrhocoris]|eukprot:XP_015654219.1 hypothetical protein ABB37_08309 [Leptomonas pyrrhocoris]
MPLFHAVMYVDESEGVDRIEPMPERVWGLRVECASCKEESANTMYVNAEETHEREGGTHHFVWKCKACKSDVTVDVMPVPAGSGYYSAVEDNAANIIAVFEVRGGQPTAMEVDNQWVVVANSGARFEEADLSEDWCDYDEKGQMSVTVSGVTVEFDKAKKAKR